MMDSSRKSAIRTRSHSLIQQSGVSSSNSSGGNSNATTQQTTVTTSRTRHKSGNASYADLITRAVLSTDEKRLTLSEIYDWMVDNVPGLKDQRYLHSAKGWKNAVRHTLSINPRFRKVARLGRPGWWTVDPEYLNRTVAASLGVVIPPPLQSSAMIHHTAPSTPVSGGQYGGGSSSNGAVIWTDQQQSHFRGRLSSAPALFLSPVFAAQQQQLHHHNDGGFHSSTTANSTTASMASISRPPSVMSILSGSGGASSPSSEMGTTMSSSSILSPPQFVHSPHPIDVVAAASSSSTSMATNPTQHVQVWGERGGVGMLAVPRPLPVRMSTVNETGTQTDEMHQPGSAMPMLLEPTDPGHPRFPACGYFENVSPVSPPLTGSNASAIAPGLSIHTRTQAEQTPIFTEYPISNSNSSPITDQSMVRMALGRDPEGGHLLLVTTVNGRRPPVDDWHESMDLTGQGGNQTSPRLEQSIRTRFASDQSILGQTSCDQLEGLVPIKEDPTIPRSGGDQMHLQPMASDLGIDGSQQLCGQSFLNTPRINPSISGSIDHHPTLGRTLFDQSIIARPSSDQSISYPPITDQSPPAGCGDQQLMTCNFDSSTIDQRYHPNSYRITDLTDDRKPIDLISPPIFAPRRRRHPLQLPEDLEDIDVDPMVRCDVVAVIKYEQNLDRPSAQTKLELDHCSNGSCKSM